MAAVTVATEERNVSGKLRHVHSKLTAPADGDTYDTGLLKIHAVQVTMTGATIAAGDYAGVTSVSGGVVTFEIVGTARDLYVSVFGV